MKLFCLGCVCGVVAWIVVGGIISATIERTTLAVESPTGTHRILIKEFLHRFGDARNADVVLEDTKHGVAKVIYRTPDTASEPGSEYIHWSEQANWGMICSKGCNAKPRIVDQAGREVVLLIDLGTGTVYCNAYYGHRGELIPFSAKMCHEAGFVVSEVPRD